MSYSPVGIVGTIAAFAVVCYVAITQYSAPVAAVVVIVVLRFLDTFEREVTRIYAHAGGVWAYVWRDR